MTKEEYLARGMEYFSEDQLELATQELEKSLQEDPRYGDALHAIAMTYYHQEEYARAVEYGERFREAEPDNIHAYTCLSMFYNAQGLITEAEEMNAEAARLGQAEE
jgi:Tfp pilus assembly protein PilF